MLTSHDAEYLQQYVTLCQQFIGGAIPLGRDYRYDQTGNEVNCAPDPESAVAKLQVLNAQYSSLVSPNILKPRILATILAAHESDNPEGWAVSGICY